MSENNGPRRTSRINAGMMPSRHGDWVFSRQSKTQPENSVATPGTSGVCHSNATPANQTVEDFKNSESESEFNYSVKSKTKNRNSKLSTRSIRSSGSSLRRMNLQAEVDTQAKMNQLHNEEDDVNAALLELKRSKILREKSLAEKALELEKSKLEELDSDDDSERLSDFDENHVLNDNEFVPQANKCNTWVKNVIEPTPSLIDQFQLYSQCIADAIANSNRVPVQRNERSDLNKFVARQSGAKDLPNYFGDSEDWPSFIAAFHRSTKSCEFSDEDNLVRLQKCLKGRAKESVQGLLIAPENVKQILKVLERKFGQPAHIIENMVKKVQNIPRLKDDKPEQIVEFANSVENLAATVESLKRPQYLQNPILLKELVGKMPFHLSLRWGEKVAATLEASMEPDLKDFANWLSTISDAMSMSNILPVVYDKPIVKPHRVGKNEIVMTTTEPVSNSTKKKFCICCTKIGHKIDECKQFVKLNNDDRWKEVKSKRVCFCCLEKGHNLNSCTKRKSCGIDGCQRPHHKLLHQDEVKPANPKAETTTETVMVCRTNENPRIMLKVLPVKISGPGGEEQTYAILDDCATCTLIEESLANRLRLKGYSDPLEIQGTTTLIHSDPGSRRVCLDISGLKSTKKFQLDNVRTASSLDLPTQSINVRLLKEEWSHLPDIDLASFRNAKPKILLGQDCTDLIVSREVIDGPRHGPMISRTKLGWVIHGNNYAIRGRVDHEIVCITVDSPENTLHDLVKSHYALESIGVKYCAAEVIPKDEARAKVILEKTTKRVGKRFETGLLWKFDAVQLPESKSQALRRLKSVEKKMDSDADYCKLYSEKMEDYIKKNYAIKLSPEEAAVEHPKNWYLPHFGVVNPNKPGKLRIVFDAAAKSHGMSLNDHLLAGPDLYNALPGVFFKFREKEIALAADIKEMFPQIKIRNEDSKAQRFLWRGSNRSNPPEVYEMKSMVFGIISSPSSAQYVRNLNAEDFKQEFPEAYQMITRRHYMDDGLSSSHTEAEALKLAQEVIYIHSHGGFQICNWLSNSKAVLAKLPQDLVAEKVKSIGLKEAEHSERILGQKWKPFQDVLYFCVDLHKVPPEVKNMIRKPTKGEVLQLIMSIFDPIGLLANFTIQPKILLQNIWRTGAEWSAELPENMFDEWKRFLTQLRVLESLTIPRCYSPEIKNVKFIELHIFTDASSLAYAAAGYLRLEFPDHVSTSFVMAKSRVAPLKSTSIPRLELQAAVMGTRMAKFIEDEHSLHIQKVHFWTDSTTVLCWIRSDSRKFKTFVANRIGEIEDTTVENQWHWVPTKENVADEATRNKEDVQFSADSRWYQGPAFLKFAIDQWPKETHNNKRPNSDDLELKKEFVCLTLKIDRYMPDPSRFSSLMHLLRTTAWTRRFVSRVLRKPMCTSVLSATEIENAEKIWLGHCQLQSFPEEVYLLKENKPLKVTSKLLCLSPFLDDEGILRVKSRIENSPDIESTAKYPAILDPKHLYTKLLIKWYHVKFNHHNQDLVVNELRQKYWILQIRAAVRSTWSNCQVCKNWRARPEIPTMAALPAMRVTKFMRPFTHTGMDCFGPMNVRIGRSTVKRYGLIFTCMSTRAIHLEVLDSMTTDSTILAIRRFISRRGCPASFYSDNGSNFHGADNELKKAWTEIEFEKLQTEVANKQTSWNFNPPLSPHFGGVWERLIKSVKIALKFTLKELTPRQEVLITLLCEAEMSINSRPLTHVSLDPDDPEALTPNHFLIGTSGSFPTPGKFTGQDLYLRKHWRLAQRLADLFWKRWMKEYLPTLTKREKWNHTKNLPIKVDDVVIIADDHSPRNIWPKGIVVATYSGKDGNIRVADVKTVTGVYRRPVAKLIVLDVRPRGSEDLH